MILSVFIVIAFAALLVQLVFQALISSGLKTIDNRKEQTASSQTLPLSLIIVAKNEADNLKKNIPSFLNQDHAQFELILVNDHSDDETLEVMMQFARLNPVIQIVDLPDSQRGKKAGLAEGIQLSKHEHLVFTDADCWVETDKWLSGFGRAFSDGYNFIIGQGAYVNEGNWFSRFYSFEASRTAILFMSSAALGSPYMCVGRSMAYTKSLFYDSGGFETHKEMDTGSDDLFLQAALPNANVYAAPDLITYSNAPKTWNAWLKQRKRHASAGLYYPKKILFLLWTYELSNFLIPIYALLFVCFFSAFSLLFFVVLAVRISLFVFNVQKFSALMKVKNELSELWWIEYPMSWMNALISMNIGLMKKEEWTIRR